MAELDSFLKDLRAAGLRSFVEQLQNAWARLDALANGMQQAVARGARLDVADVITALGRRHNRDTAMGAPIDVRDRLVQLALASEEFNHIWDAAEKALREAKT